MEEMKIEYGTMTPAQATTLLRIKEEGGHATLVFGRGWQFRNGSPVENAEELHEAGYLTNGTINVSAYATAFYTIAAWAVSINTPFGLRDWFAGMALCGPIAELTGTAEEHAQIAYEYADAMLVFRSDV